MRRRLVAVPATLLLLSGLAACGGSDGDSGSNSGSGSISGIDVTGDFGKEAKVAVDGLDVSKAESEETIEGDGAEVTDDSAVKYRFAIAKGSDGSEVTSNFSQPDPETLTIADQPPTIKDALLGSTIGSRVVVAVPVKDVLGDQGAPQAGLGPDDDVVFVFDLVSEAEKPLTEPQGDPVDPPADAPKVETDGDATTGDVTGLDFSDAPAKPSSKLQVIPLVEGDGPALKSGDSFTANYYGAVYGEDKPFDSSYASGQPLQADLTQGALIDGWTQALDGVKVGSRVMLIIPPDLGYGAQGGGAGSDIPGGATLVFVIDVLGANL